jgi:hypothetical protein
VFLEAMSRLYSYNAEAAECVFATLAVLPVGQSPDDLDLL